MRSVLHKMATSLTCLFTFVLLVSFVCVFSDRTPPINNCVGISSQTSLDIDQLMGIWHGIEIIQHQHNRDPQPTTETCPVIFISETPMEEIPSSTVDYGYRTDHESGYDYNHRRNYNRGQQTNRYNLQHWRNMSLLWDEGPFTVRYSLKFDRSKPGFWISYGPQNGSSLMDKKFNSFAGHVQVLKAVGTHLVLTFCHIMPHNELFTIVLARQQTLDDQDIVSVHKLLMRRKLSAGQVRKVCRNSSSQLENHLLYAFAAFVVMKIYNYIA